MTEFTKADLKPGYLIEKRIGTQRIVMPTTKGLVLVHQHKAMYDDVDDFSNNLTFLGSKMHDIVKVWGFTSCMHSVLDFTTENRELLWERKEPKKNDSC
jgi:hypothetical protein